LRWEWGPPLLADQIVVTLLIHLVQHRQAVNHVAGC
jgi:hypothetical protein